MDTLSHYLWTVPFYWKHPKRWWLGIVGAAPDLLSFGLLILLTLLGVYPSYGGGPPPLATMPGWVPIMYDLTHSLVICAAGIFAVWLWKREMAFLLIGWPLHIILDIPTHTRAYFPTPFLWPISGITLDAMSWSVPWFFTLNWALLFATYAWLVLGSRISTWRHRTAGSRSR